MEEITLSRRPKGRKALTNLPKHTSTSTQLKPTAKPFRKSDSITGVNPFRSHGVGVWGNRRILVGIRVDEGLYSVFKPIAQRVFGSVCRPIEAFMACIVATAKEGVNFGNTIEIGKLVIERNLRSRRRLVIEEEFGVSPFPTGEFGVCLKCGVKLGVVKLYRVRFVSGLVADVCRECLEDYRHRTLVKAVLGAVEDSQHREQVAITKHKGGDV